MTAIGIVSADRARPERRAGKDASPRQRHAQQFAWSFSLPGREQPYERRPAPARGRSVELSFKANDVIHSFWVPEFGQSRTPSRASHELHITPDKLGTFPVICTELCGLGHATMRTEAIVMTTAAFDKWLKSQTTATTSPNPAVVRRRRLQEPALRLVSHARRSRRDRKGRPRPRQAAQWATQAKQPLEPFISTSITDPNAYTQPGFPKNVMPPLASLPKAQLDALVQY